MSVVFDPDEFSRSNGEEPPFPDAEPAGGLHAQRADAFLAEEIPDPRWLALDILPERATASSAAPRRS